MKRSSAQRGYSLVEALVVVAIVGMVSLVTVPNFISMYRASKFKSSVRMLNSDIRAARQNAVTRNKLTRLSFETGIGERTYEIAEATGQDPATAAWIVIDEKVLEDTVYFFSAGFANVDSSADGSLDVVFKNDGTAHESEQIVIRTTDKIPHNQFNIDVSAVGKLTTTKGKF